jgi:hypothetical protein
MARVDAPTSEAGWGCVHSLAFQRRHQCQDTDYRFKISWAVPSYQLDWMILSYSMGSHWGLLGQLLVVASGAPFIPACRLVPHSHIRANHRHFTTFGLWSRVERQLLAR